MLDDSYPNPAGNPLDQPDRQARLNQSRLGGTAPAAPVYPYHALAGGRELADRFAGRATHPDCF